jgi:hypothetical protein
MKGANLGVISDVSAMMKERLPNRSGRDEATWALVFDVGSFGDDVAPARLPGIDSLDTLNAAELEARRPNEAPESSPDLSRDYFVVAYS